MVKVFIKETIIILILCVIILLILGVLLYDYNPVNKVVPSMIAYSTPEDIKNELQENVENTLLDLKPKVYNIEGADLNSYQRSNTYNPSKENPFVESSGDATPTSAGDTTGGSSGAPSSSTPKTENESTSSSSNSVSTPATKLK